jgi:hypothetical protein
LQSVLEFGQYFNRANGRRVWLPAVARAIVDGTPGRVQGADGGEGKIGQAPTLLEGTVIMASEGGSRKTRSRTSKGLRCHPIPTFSTEKTQCTQSGAAI